MASPLSASMPQFAQLGYNCEVVLEALDPATGAPVAGVSVSAVEIWADVTIPATSTPGSLVPAGPFMLVPGPGA